jgi:hypothetical protein
MAYFNPSALVNGQAKFAENFLKGEWRLPDSVAFDNATVAQIANPLLSEIRTREDRTVLAYYPIRQAAIGGTARAHNHTGARGDSLSETISWSTLSEPFSISLKQADNNVFDWPTMYAATLKNAVLNILSRADVSLVASLVADKTHINGGGGDGSFNGTTFNYEVPQAQADYFFGNIEATVQHNQYKGQIITIADSKATMLYKKLLGFGAQNSENKLVQLMNQTILPTTRTLLGAGFEGSAISFEAGLAAMIPWIPKQNRKPLDPAKVWDFNGDYGQITVPGFPYPLAVHMYAAKADNSSAGGYTQDLTLYGEVSIDLAYSSAPLSTFNGAADSPIFAIGLLA